MQMPPMELALPLTGLCKLRPLPTRDVKGRQRELRTNLPGLGHPAALESWKSRSEGKCCTRGRTRPLQAVLL